MWLTCEFDLLDHVQVLVEQHDRRQSADRSLHGQELAELVAGLIEQRLRAREFNGGRDGIGSRELRVLADIGVGNDQRVFDQRMRLLREQPVEPAVERDACHHRHQDRRRGGDDRKQGNDPHVQPRSGPATAAGLEHPPHLPANQSDQERDGHRIGEEKRDHDLMGRSNRREPGQHHEGREGRQQRQNDYENADRTHDPGRWGRSGSCEFGLADLCHQLNAPNQITR